MARGGRVAPGTFRNLVAPPKYRGKLCISGPWSLQVGSNGVLTAVGGGGCLLKSCISTGPVCPYPRLTAALIWQRGRSRLLEDFIPAHTRWWLKDATAINARGQIAGTAWFGRKTVPFLLTPNATG